MKTDQGVDIAAGTTAPVRNGSAPSSQGTGAPVRRDLHAWYRWGRRDQWLHAFTGRPQIIDRPPFTDQQGLAWPQREEWLNASWKTRLWWFRQDFLHTPLKGWPRCRELVREYGDLVARQHDISPARQTVEQVWLHQRYGVSPDMYYMYRLFIPRLRRQAGAFIPWREMCPLHRQLHSRTSPEEAQVLADKVRFYARCKAHDVPTVPVLVSFEGGEMTLQEWDGPQAPLPRKDLFSKNADQDSGKEAIRWRYVGSGRYEGEREAVDQNGLITMLKERSSELPLLLQECCVNDERIAGLTSGGLSTIRVVTGRLPDGPPEPLFASVRMPTGAGVLDNFSAGGIAAPVDLETGRLGSALPIYPRPGPPRHTVHPDTRHPIEGFEMPRWEEIVELSLRAHRAFPAMPFVGWDVAFTERGLLVVEGNEEWGDDIVQIPYERPLTDTVFQEYYDAWMQRYLETGRSI